MEEKRTDIEDLVLELVLNDALEVKNKITHNGGEL